MFLSVHVLFIDPLIRMSCIILIQKEADICENFTFRQFQIIFLESNSGSLSFTIDQHYACQSDIRYPMIMHNNCM